MKKYLVFIAFVLVLACGRYDKQYSKVISPNETLSTKVDCFTFAGFPFACIQIQNYEKTVEIVEIVERVVNQIVIETEYVEVETIVREVHAVYSEKDVDIGSIIVEVIGILTRDYPVIAAPGIKPTAFGNRDLRYKGRCRECAVGCYQCGNPYRNYRTTADYPSKHCSNRPST